MFDAYCDKKLLCTTGRLEMSVTGFLRLLRDACLLDNRLGLVEADAVFTGGQPGEVPRERGEVGGGGRHGSRGQHRPRWP